MAGDLFLGQRAVRLARGRGAASPCGLLLLEFEKHGHQLDNIASIDPAGTGRRNPWLQTGGFSTGQTVSAESPPAAVGTGSFQALP